MLLAIRTLSPAVKGPYLANNPWIAAALRLTGRTNFAVTGIYAEPASRSWRILRRLIGGALVITLSESEAGPWNNAGGRAKAVLYGNTFGYPEATETDAFHVFVGGSSDRDMRLISALEAEVLDSELPVKLTLATGGVPERKVSGCNSIVRLAPLSQKEFGSTLSTASIVFLPLVEGTRAAGHMVLVGALESGIPVAITPNLGIAEYVSRPIVSICDVDRPLLQQLRAIVDASASGGHSPYSLWNEKFSLEAYVSRVCSILDD